MKLQTYRKTLRTARHTVCSLPTEVKSETPKTMAIFHAWLGTEPHNSTGKSIVYLLKNKWNAWKTKLIATYGQSSILKMWLSISYINTSNLLPESRFEVVSNILGGTVLQNPDFTLHKNCRSRDQHLTKRFRYILASFKSC